MLRQLTLTIALASLSVSAGAAPGYHGKPFKMMQLKQVSGSLRIGTYATTLTFRGDTCPFPPQAAPVGQPVSGKMQISNAGNGIFSFDLPAATSYFKAAMPVNATSNGTLYYTGSVPLHLSYGAGDINLTAGLQGTYTAHSFSLSGPLNNGSQCAISITLEGSLTQ